MGPERSGRTALVTGGSHGIGKAIARALAEQATNVVILARQRDALEAAAADLQALNGEVRYVVADVTDETAVQNAVEQAVAWFGRLDVLVNNAGGATPIAAFEELTNQDWRNAFELNVMSVVQSVRTSLPWLRRSGTGRIVNIASITGIEPGQLVPHYSAAKAAVINLSKHLANALAVDSILVNVVCPGQVNSEGRRTFARQVAAERKISFADALHEINAKGAAAIPLGRIGEPDDVGALVAFLASEKCSWITGSCFHVNGGKHRSAF